MAIDPTRYCSCHLNSWSSLQTREIEGLVKCTNCKMEVLPEEYCRCDPMSRLGSKDQVVDGARFCGKCTKQLAWLPKTHVEPENETELVLTTIDSVPGYRITEVIGLVTQLAGSSGLTAGVKGRDAKSGALRALNKSALSMGANAVVGIQFSAFGAGGGLTNVFGGDAVGVLVSGTAVTIEKIEVSKTTANPTE
jgi:uncharacterized protein YbjQ (UPF0145 family)